ncbi:hypothetical protein C8J57DRAFT_1475978 [Mycena rebaudengoi]|nr:hypothetical protein C8J57DRAFT_1475978 [Mycena rebaudengoi]
MWVGPGPPLFTFSPQDPHAARLTHHAQRKAPPHAPRRSPPHSQSTTRPPRPSSPTPRPTYSTPHAHLTPARFSSSSSHHLSSNHLSTSDDLSDSPTSPEPPRSPTLSDDTDEESTPVRVRGFAFPKPVPAPVNGAPAPVNGAAPAIVNGANTNGTTAAAPPPPKPNPPAKTNGKPNKQKTKQQRPGVLIPFALPTTLPTTSVNTTETPSPSTSALSPLPYQHHFPAGARALADFGYSSSAGHSNSTSISTDTGTTSLTSGSGTSAGTSAPTTSAGKKSSAAGESGSGGSAADLQLLDAADLPLPSAAGAAHFRVSARTGAGVEAVFGWVAGRLVRPPAVLGQHHSALSPGAGGPRSPGDLGGKRGGAEERLRLGLRGAGDGGKGKNMFWLSARAGGESNPGCSSMNSTTNRFDLEDACNRTLPALCCKTHAD